MDDFRTYKQMLRLSDALASESAELVETLKSEDQRLGRSWLDPLLPGRLDSFRRVIRFQFCIMDELSGLMSAQSIPSDRS